MLITVSLFNTMLALKKLSLRASVLKCQEENECYCVVLEQR